MNFFYIYFIVVFFFFLPSASFANDGNNIKILNTDLSFPIVSKYKKSDNYYLQFLYTERTKSVALNKTKLIQGSIPYPIAMQPYNRGYRFYVGPIKGGDISSAQKLLFSIGYEQYFIRHINNQSDFLMANDILFKKIGRIKNNNIIIPFYRNGSLARFSSLDVDNVCKTINVNSYIALLSEYIDILSSSDFISDIGSQYRFWLTPEKTVTRVSDKLVIKTANDHARYPIICLINHSSHK